MSQARTEITNLATQFDSLAYATNDLEDRSRRNNVLFRGIADCKETWAETENKIVAILSSCTEGTFNPDSIERAHRLGSYTQSRCRPIIVKFNHYKTREKVFSLRTQLKDQEITISEDFSVGTRLARQKLLEFAKSQPGSPAFQLKYKQLHMNKKRYIYDTLTTTIKEIEYTLRSPMAYESAQNRSPELPRSSS